MSRIGRQAHRRARRRRRRRRARARVASTGPKGELDQSVKPRHDGRRRRTATLLVDAPDRPRRAPRAARAHAQPDREHGRGRHRRLREAPRDPGRRLPRRSSRARTSSWRSATRTRSRSRRPRASSSRSRSRRESIVRGHRQAARRRDRRATSASSARRSPTRARASATRASTSPGRSARALA